MEKTEASRAKRGSIEDDQIALAEAAEDKASQPRGGLLAKLKGLFLKEQAERIAAQRIRDHADRLADRRARDAEARELLTAAQARDREITRRPAPCGRPRNARTSASGSGNVKPKSASGQCARDGRSDDDSRDDDGGRDGVDR